MDEVKQPTIFEFDEKIEPIFPNVKQVKIKESIIGENITIKDYKEVEGDKGTFFVILANLNNEDVSFSCGSKSIMKQIKKMREENHLPARAFFKKVKGKESGNSYYTLTKPQVD